MELERVMAKSSRASGFPLVGASFAQAHAHPKFWTASHSSSWPRHVTLSLVLNFIAFYNSLLLLLPFLFVLQLFPVLTMQTRNHSICPEAVILAWGLGAFTRDIWCLLLMYSSHRRRNSELRFFPERRQLPCDSPELLRQSCSVQSQGDSRDGGEHGSAAAASHSTGSPGASRACQALLLEPKIPRWQTDQTRFPPSQSLCASGESCKWSQEGIVPGGDTDHDENQTG